MTADAFINCRVTSETKARLRALALREGTNESAIVKQLLHDALRTLTPCADSSRATPSRIERRERVCVRIGSEDRRLLNERASARGLAPGTYVALLVRTHVQGRAPLPRAEYLALRESVLELKAIGRNLNQIARALNRGAYAEMPGGAAVDAILKVVEELRDHFRDLLKANDVSWKNNGPTRH
jgi:Bacterial mobilisation protein (MobC)